MFRTYLNAIRLFNRDICLFLITTAVTGFCYVGIYVMLFNLYLLRLGYGLAFIGLANGVAQMGMALFSLPAGSLGQRWGSRRMLIVGLSIAVAGLGLLPLAELLPSAWQAGWLVSTYVFAWLGGALFIVNGNPFLMETTEQAERQHVFSVRQALLPLSAFGGSLVGGLLPSLLATPLGISLDQPEPYRYALFIAAGLFIPAVLALMATRKLSTERSTGSTPGQHLPGRNVPRSAVPIGLISFIALVVFLQVAGNSSANIFFNVYLDNGLQLPTVWIGVLAALGKLLATPAALATPFLVTRWGQRRTIILGILGLACALLPLALIPHWGAAGLGFMGVSALFAFTAPVFAICQQEIVSPEWRSTMAGAIAMTTGLGTAAVAFGGGYLITAFGYRSLFLTCAGLTAFGATLFWAYTWLPRFVILHRAALGKPVHKQGAGVFRSILNTIIQ